MRTEISFSCVLEPQLAVPPAAHSLDLAHCLKHNIPRRNTS